MRPARESRVGSASLGRNFLAAMAGLGEEFCTAREALRVSKQSGGLVQHSVAFGLAGGLVGATEERTALADLHQSVTGLVSAGPRLMPLGHSTATKSLWGAKTVMLQTIARSALCEAEDAFCFTPQLDWGAMEHPALTTRLFIS